MNLYVDTAANANWVWKEDRLHPSQPVLIRLAWGTDEPGSERCVLVKSGARAIDPETFARDGVSIADIESLGVPLADALDDFCAALADADTIVGFSWDFHRKVIERAVALLGRDPIVWPQTVCAMRAAAPVVKIRMQKNNQWAWPSMFMAYKHFAGEVMVRTADPVADGITQVTTLRQIHQGTKAALVEAA